MDAKPRLPPVQFPRQAGLRTRMPCSSAHEMVRVFSLNPTRDAEEASKELVFPVIPDRELEPRPHLDIVGRRLAKTNVPLHAGARKDRPHASVEVTDSVWGFTDVRSLTTLSTPVPNMDTSTKVGEALDGVFHVILLPVDDRLETLAKVPAHPAEARIDGFSKTGLFLFSVVRRMLYPVVPVASVPTPRTKFFSKRCLQPCLDVLLLFKDRSVSDVRPAVPERSERSVFSCRLGFKPRERFGQRRVAHANGITVIRR